MQHDELKTPAVMKRIAELRDLGISWDSITKTCNKEFHANATQQLYHHMYERYATKRGEIIANNEELKEEIITTVFDTISQLKEINTVMRHILADPKDKSKDKISAAKEILNQLYFQEKILKRMNDGFNIEKVNKIEYTRISVNNLTELEKTGHILILKKPGETFDPSKKMKVHLDPEAFNTLNKEGKVELPAFIVTINKDIVEANYEDVKEDEKEDPVIGGDVIPEFLEEENDGTIN